MVQDFVQTTEDEETPREWLHRIMETSSREAGDYDINLMGKVRGWDNYQMYEMLCHFFSLVPSVSAFAFICDIHICKSQCTQAIIYKDISSSVRSN